MINPIISQKDREQASKFHCKKIYGLNSDKKGQEMGEGLGLGLGVYYPNLGGHFHDLREKMNDVRGNSRGGLFGARRGGGEGGSKSRPKKSQRFDHFEELTSSIVKRVRDDPFVDGGFKLDNWNRGGENLNVKLALHKKKHGYKNSKGVSSGLMDRKGSFQEERSDFMELVND